ISLARRSSRFSRSSSLIRSRSAVVGPGRLPRSRSACRTQLRSVSPEQPIFAAIDWMAAHCDAYSRSCSNTSRTARSRTSVESVFAGLMPPSSPELESPANPGRFKASLFFRLVSARYEKGSIVLTSNKHVRDWPEIFAGDEILTTAILDRLLHHVHLVHIDGRSYRLRELARLLEPQAPGASPPPERGGEIKKL